jgi:hypothetical protein
MIDFLVIQVRLGKITVEQVPSRYRDAVLAALTVA